MKVITKNSELTSFSSLLKDISQLIDSAQKQVAQSVNSSLVILFWRIGQRTHKEVLQEERAEYGQAIVSSLSKDLTFTYGKGYSRPNLFKMIKFAKQFPDFEIVSTLSRQLSWSHFVELILFDDSLKRQFYTEMCRLEHWGVRDLRKKISSMLYERTAISRKPKELIERDLKTLQERNEISQELVFRDPIILDFLHLPSSFSEFDLENAILDELCKFLQELGSDFCFIARQKRITIDQDDYYIDLLTFHRGLKRLIAIELKLDSFLASHKGQMELYLRWLNKYERKPNEEEPLGIILCSNKKQEHVELLELDKSGIHVAQYLTQLPPREILEERLRKAIEVARERQARLPSNDEPEFSLPKPSNN